MTRDREGLPPVQPPDDVQAPARLEVMCAAFVAVGLVASFIWPWIPEMATAIPDAAQTGSRSWGADARLIVWILAWVAHAITTDPSRLFDANIFHPIPSMLTGSEHLLTSVAFSGPVYAVTGNPILAANVAVMSTYVLAAVVTYVLMRSLRLPIVAAGVAGAAFALGPVQVPVDLHVLQYPIWALALVLLVAVRATSSGRYLWVMPAVTVAVFTSYYMAVMTGALLACESGVTWRTRGRWPAVWLLAAATPAFAMLMLFSLPYIDGTTLRSQSVGAPPAVWAWAWGKMIDPGNVFPGFGWGLPVLASAGLLVPLAQRTRPTARWWRWVLLTALGVCLAAPPTLSVGALQVPMPSAVLLAYTPLRAILSWILLAHLGLVGLAAEGAAAGVGWFTRYVTVALPLRVVLGGALIAAVWTPRALHLLDQPRTVLPTVHTVPDAHRWLAANASGPLLEPPGPTGATWLRQADTMVLSLYHWLPLLNGHTGHVPWAYGAITPEFARLPDREALQALVDLTGLAWVLVRRERVSDRYFAAWEAFASADESVDRVPYGGPDLLLRVTLAPRHDWAVALTRGRALPGRTILGTALAPLDDAKVQGLIRGSGPSWARAGKKLSAKVVISNTGTQAWPALIAPGAPEAGVVRLVVRWRAHDTSLAGESVHAIPRDVVPGEPLHFSTYVPVPVRRGRYDLEIGVEQMEGASMRAVVSGPMPVVVGTRARPRHTRGEGKRRPRIDA